MRVCSKSIAPKTCYVLMPVIVTNFIALGQAMYEKCYKKRIQLSVTNRPTKEQ